MQRKLLRGRHVILWKSKRGEEFPYFIAQLFIALYLSTTTPKTLTNKMKPINEIQNKNHKKIDRETKNREVKPGFCI